MSEEKKKLLEARHLFKCEYFGSEDVFVNHNSNSKPKLNNACIYEYVRIAHRKKVAHAKSFRAKYFMHAQSGN